MVREIREEPEGRPGGPGDLKTAREVLQLCPGLPRERTHNSMPGSMARERTHNICIHSTYIYVVRVFIYTTARSFVTHDMLPSFLTIKESDFTSQYSCQICNLAMVTEFVHEALVAAIMDMTRIRGRTRLSGLQSHGVAY